MTDDRPLGGSSRCGPEVPRELADLLDADGRLVLEGAGAEEERAALRAKRAELRRRLAP